MKKLQDLFNQISEEQVSLPYGIYEGPLVINRSCEINGNDSIIRADEGIVIVVLASRVAIKNLQIEVTGETDDVVSQTALFTAYDDVQLENVTVWGHCVGIYNENPFWFLPKVISLENLEANVENKIFLHFTLPMEAKVNGNISGLSCINKHLQRGSNQLILKSVKLAPNSVVYGELEITTCVTRKILVKGSVFSPKSIRPVNVKRQSEFSIDLEMNENLPNIVQKISRGERLPVSVIDSQNLSMVFSYDKLIKSKIEIDCFCYLLQDNGKVSEDNDFLFYGNPESPAGELIQRLYEPVSVISVNLRKIKSPVTKIAVCYVIYQDNNVIKNFSMVSHSTVWVWGRKGIYYFPISNLKTEKAIVALELYRHNNEWKLNFIGSGYKDGVEKLCNEYGVEIE